MYQYPYMPYLPPPTSSEEAWKLYKRIKKMEKQDKGGDKKDDKKKSKLSPFTALQWMVILCCAGPFVAPWTIVALINSWQIALSAIKQSLN